MCGYKLPEDELNYVEEDPDWEEGADGNLDIPRLALLLWMHIASLR